MAEKEVNIFKQLQQAQHEIVAPRQAGGRFGKARSAEQILEAAKPVLAKYGLAVTITEEMILVGDKVFIKSTATAINEDGDHLSAIGHAWHGEMDRGLDTSQVTGKTSSYAKKYALQNLLAIDDTKDADFDSDEDVKARTEAEEHRKRVMDVMSLKDKPNAELENIKTEIDHMLEDAGHNAVKRKAALNKLTTVEEAQRALDAMKGGK